MKLNKDKINQYLFAKQADAKNILILESTGSTNAEALELAKVGASSSTVVLTEYQSKGRGRMQRTWEASKETSLLFSIILRKSEISPGILMLSAACAVRNTILRATATDDVLIKWPNDVYLKGKKCCGILAQAGKDNRCEDFYVLGIGLNVNNPDKDFADLPLGTSLFTATDKEYDRNSLMADLLFNLDSVLAENKENILKQCRTFSYTIGKQVTVEQNGKTIYGKATAIDDDGFLIVRDQEDKEQRIICGDVL